MLASTTQFRALVNGYSGFTPRSYVQAFGLVQMLPSSDAFDGLEAIGVTHVVVHGAQLQPDFVASLVASGRLALVARDDPDAVYALRRGR